jgi:exopolysaccharide biosynthesis polyprenyl glycosylphosphotransferase
VKGRYKIIEVYGLWFADLLCIGVSFVLSTYIRFGNFRDMGDREVHFQVFLVFLLLCTVYNFMLDWNRAFTRRRFRGETVAVFKYMAFMFLIVQSIMVALKWAEVFSRLVMGYFVIVNFTLTLAVHLLIKKALRAYYASDKTAIKVLVASQKNTIDNTLDRLKKSLDAHYQISALACLDDDCVGQEIGGLPVVAHRENVLEVTTQMALDEVFIDAPELSQRRIEELIAGFDEMGVACHYNLALAEKSARTSQVEEFGGYTVVTYTRFRFSHKRYLLKRVIDIGGGLVGAVITILFFPFVALAIKIESPGPILFSQVRIGRNGRRFVIYKFRSMYRDAEERKKELETQNEMQGLMFKMENDPRITKVGRFIRKYSIDELPQFFNVVKGDMSLVGTRPPTVDEFEQYNQHYRRRISMTPGLTGLWQVNGRSDVYDFDEVVGFDLQYIDNWSLWLDFKIIFKTVVVVFAGRGAR